MGNKLRLQKLAFSRVLSRDLGLWVSAALYYRGNAENLAAYKCNSSQRENEGCSVSPFIVVTSRPLNQCEAYNYMSVITDQCSVSASYHVTSAQLQCSQRSKPLVYIVHIIGSTLNLPNSNKWAKCQ